MISLVVCTVGRTSALVRFLRSLRSQRLQDTEVLLVDQNPAGFLDATLTEAAQGLPLKTLRSERGLSRSRNRGIVAARGEIVGFPDDDCWYGPSVLERVRTFFAENRNIGVLVGRTVDAEGRDSLGRHFPHRALITKGTVFQAGTSSALFVRASVLRDIGGFDEHLGAGARFGSGEETDLLLRALRRGHAVAYEPQLAVYHEQTSEAAETRITRAAAYAPGFGRVARKHFGPLFVMGRVGRALAGAAAARLRGDETGVRERVVWARGAIDGYLTNTEQTAPRLTRRHALGVAFSPLDRHALVEAMLTREIPRGEGPRTIVTANLDHIVQLHRRDDLKIAYAKAWAATADGMPVYVYARLRGVDVPERVTGSDVFADLMARLDPGKHRCFFVASTASVAEGLLERIERRGFAREAIASRVPPFGFERDADYGRALAAQICDHGATHVFLGVGAPKSEVWAETHRDLLGDCYVLSCGAALEYATGVRTRAPVALQRAGLEWLWRFAQEPTRLFSRYFISSWVFFDAIRVDLIRDRGTPQP